MEIPQTVTIKDDSKEESIQSLAMYLAREHKERTGVYVCWKSKLIGARNLYGGIENFVQKRKSVRNLSIPLFIGLEYLLLSTDGVGSFENEDRLPYSRHIVNPRVTAFKGLNGEFIQRRMKRMMKTTKKEGLHHYDDFTIAGVSSIKGEYGSR